MLTVLVLLERGDGYTHKESEGKTRYSYSLYQARSSEFMTRMAELMESSIINIFSRSILLIFSLFTRFKSKTLLKEKICFTTQPIHFDFLIEFNSLRHCQGKFPSPASLWPHDPAFPRKFHAASTTQSHGWKTIDFKCCLLLKLIKVRVEAPFETLYIEHDFVSCQLGSYPPG